MSSEEVKLKAIWTTESHEVEVFVGRRVVHIRIVQPPRSLGVVLTPSEAESLALALKAMVEAIKQERKEREM